MKKALRRNLSLYTRNFLPPPTFQPNPNSSSPLVLSLTSTLSQFRSYSSSENDSSNKNPKSLSDANSTPPHTQDTTDVEEVTNTNNKELKMLMEKYSEGDEEAIPLIFEAILKRKLAGKHEETVDELMEELEHKPLDNVKDEEVDSDFEELYETDEEVEDLCDASNIGTRRIVKD